MSAHKKRGRLIGVKQSRLDGAGRSPSSKSVFGEELLAAFGRELHRLRRERGWSLQRMAAESGVSVAGIRKIEKGITNPSLHTAFSLSEALGQPLPDLVAAAGAAKAPVVAVAGTAPRIAHGSIDLADGLNPRRLHAQLVKLAPRSSLELTRLAGPLFIYVLQGQVRLQFKGGRMEELGVGDAIHMREEMPLCLENTVSRRAVALCVFDQRLSE